MGKYGPDRICVPVRAAETYAILDSGEPYVRADLYDALLAENEKMKARIRAMISRLPKVSEKLRSELTLAKAERDRALSLLLDFLSKKRAI